MSVLSTETLGRGALRAVRRASVGGLVASAIGLVMACGVPSTIGADEPLSVERGQFFEGEWPESGKDTPRITTPVVSTVLRERLRGANFSGIVSDDATAVGVRIDGYGSGYWLLPSGARDAQSPNSLAYSFNADLQGSLPAGRHTLQLVGFDKDGLAGPVSESTICVTSLRPDNGNACNPQVAPPALVLSLEWDSPADLDITVVFPTGEIVTAGRPGVLNPDDAAAPPIARLVSDANTDCRQDSRQREDVVFERLPPKGKYSIYASLYRSCGATSVSYSASYASRTQSGDTYGVRTRDLGGGVLTTEQFQRGSELGTFIAQVKVQ
ncbi:MAG: hypothetical protein B6A08_09935 [Sorangiineae bacterium NIC37A_2]|jgi:hypothetical protein|nr:MAG: hypothetical protein B6A08_09935 [Sorangiineae bacterium NIC37A_2]